MWSSFQIIWWNLLSFLRNQYLRTYPHLL
jgi:hypothetical protein